MRHYNKLTVFLFVFFFQKRMVKICGYSRLFACLRSMGNPSKKLLEVLISMITEEEDNICLKDMKLTVSSNKIKFFYYFMFYSHRLILLLVLSLIYCRGSQPF